MKYDILQILGAVVMVAFGQGLVRLFADHGNRGLLGWLPGGPAPAFVVYAVLVAAGVVLTGWAHKRAKDLGRRK
ncbi:hypothetical protein [Planomonospora venezuelensis]|uniref:Uncharacterized protein n=1 Tax=Planomonospora venezuelensis TaxID=1999 RepID=A0A841CYZ3_PLAVE|nr:hypothetical protein [Planomonospora venezuelensis]MBB5961514.1 hypothetical protein [Planomonospora venezuelensis]